MLGPELEVLPLAPVTCLGPPPCSRAQPGCAHWADAALITFQTEPSGEPRAPWSWDHRQSHISVPRSSGDHLPPFPRDPQGCARGLTRDRLGSAQRLRFQQPPPLAHQTLLVIVTITVTFTIVVVVSGIIVLIKIVIFSIVIVPPSLSSPSP